MQKTSYAARPPATVPALTPVGVQAAANPLPSWHGGAAKNRIVAFVHAVTEPTGKDYVAPAARVGVFNNDGPLWTEQPLYFQAIDTPAK